jgi:hypothetical protein
MTEGNPSNESRMHSVLNSLVYRVVLVPSDVAARWYQYYSSAAQPLGWASIISRSGQADAPSRLVGNWAYVGKFPDLYRSYINAYSSIDADAYSRAGLVGAVFVVTLLALLRLVMAAAWSWMIVGRVAYAVGMAMLFALPMQASLQAIFVANGLFIVLSLLFAWKIWK